MKNRLFILIVLVLVTVLSACAQGQPAASKIAQVVSSSVGSSQPFPCVSQQASSEKAESSEKKAAGEDGVILIKDKMFIAQISDICLNPKDYEGKKVKLEGLIYRSTFKNDTFYYIMRKSPGCCGNDGLTGMEFIWDGEIPADNEWVEALGVVEIIKEEGQKLPVLRLESLVVKKEHGVEFVTS